MLIADLKTLASVGDMIYVENLLMPLLNYQDMIDFSIDIWDK
jgi:hypothetical protein